MSTATLSPAIRRIAASASITPLVRDIGDADVLATVDLRTSSPILVADLIAEGTLILLAPGVRVLAIDDDEVFSQVVVLDGPHHGLTGWLPTQRLTAARVA